MRDSKAEIGENGSSGFGVRDLNGLPANAWDCKLTDMVVLAVREERAVVRARVLERRQKVGDDEEKMSESMAMAHWFIQVVDRYRVRERWVVTRTFGNLTRVRQHVAKGKTPCFLSLPD